MGVPRHPSGRQLGFSMELPGQLNPPFAGVGLSHVLDLDFDPDPHAPVQEVQASHVLHPPSTIACPIYNNKFFIFCISYDCINAVSRKIRYRVNTLVCVSTTLIIFSNKVDFLSTYVYNGKYGVAH